MSWAAVSDGLNDGGEISGYQLWMKTGNSGSYVLVYDGDGYPTIKSKIMTGLTTGEQYTFKALAMNFNGVGAFSSELSTYACVAPSDFAAPRRISSTLTQISLEWEEPESDGGCPITSYAVFRDDGAGSSINVEINSSNDPAIRNNPSLFEADVTFFPASMEGESFYFQIVAYNQVGQVLSETSAFILGTAPSAPPTAPVLNAANTDNT